MKKSTRLILSIALIVAFALLSLGLTSIPVKSIKLNTTSFSVPVGKTFILKASITPDNATNKKLIFTSGNKSIATVDKNGLIKGLKSGKTVITVASSNGVKARCSVTIEALKWITVTVGEWGGAMATAIDKPELMAKDPILNYIKNKFKMNFKFEAFVPDNYNQYFSLRLATGNLPDICDSQGWPVIQDNWLEWRSVLLDLGGIVFANQSRYPIMYDVFKDKNYRFANTISNFDINDYHAILSPSFAKPSAISSGVPAYNKKFLDNLNKTFPKTTDEFIDLIRAFVNNDPDKNGKKDTGGLLLPYYGGNNLLLELEPLFFRTNGTYAQNLHQDNNGNWYDAAIATVNKPIWKLLAQLFAEGVFDKEYITRTNIGVYEEGFNTGKFGAISERFPGGPAAGQFTYYLGMFLKANPGTTYKDMPMQPTPLVGPKGQVGKDVIEWQVSQKILVSKATKAPERILDLLEFLRFSYEGNVLRNCGIKGIHYSIDSSGNIIVNKEKFRNEIAAIYYPNEPTRLQWMPFFRGNNAGQEFVNYPKYKNNWFMANKNGIFYSSTLQPVNEEYKYYAELNAKYEDSNYFNFLPAYHWAATGLIPKSDLDRYNSIKTKQADIAKEYMNAFFSNKYSVDEKWDEYVSKYKAADPDNFVITTWTKAFNIAKQKYEDAFK